MPAAEHSSVFDQALLNKLMPPETTDQFFEALFGDADEGAYNISLAFRQGSPERLEFEFHLTSKPGKCLACNLTLGLPNVFTRHPVINIKGLADKIAAQLDGRYKIDRWHCGETIERTPDLHVIPLYLDISPANYIGVKIFGSGKSFPPLRNRLWGPLGRIGSQSPAIAARGSIGPDNRCQSGLQPD